MTVLDPSDYWISINVMTVVIIVLVCFLFQSCIVAVVVPDPETIPKFAADKLGLKGEMSELCQSAVRHTPTIAWLIVIIGCPSSVCPFDFCLQSPLNYISS